METMTDFKNSIESELDQFQSDTFSVKDKKGGRDKATGRRRSKTYKLDSDDINKLNTTPLGQTTDVNPERVQNPENYRQIEFFVNKFDAIIPRSLSLEQFGLSAAIDFIKPYDGLIYVTKDFQFMLFDKSQFLKDFKFVSISQMTRPQFYYSPEISSDN